MVLRARSDASVHRAKYCGWSGTSSRLLYSRLRKAWSGAFMSAALLAPQAERLLAGAVGEREEHRLRGRLEAQRRPRGHHERVARLEIEALVADPRGARTFDDRVHGAVGRAMGLAAEAPGQQLQEGADGRHRVPAGERVDELHLPAVAGVGRLVLGELGERLAAARIRVVEDRRGLAERRFGPDRQQVGPEARGGSAFAARHRLHLLRERLVELRAEGLDDADVEPVQPHHWLLARVAVVVPGPRRRDDEIP